MKDETVSMRDKLTAALKACQQENDLKNGFASRAELQRYLGVSDWHWRNTLREVFRKHQVETVPINGRTVKYSVVGALQALRSEFGGKQQ